jgi:hypothetical protein
MDGFGIRVGRCERHHMKMPTDFGDLDWGDTSCASGSSDPGRVGGRNDHGGGGRRHSQRPGVPQELLPVRLEQGRKD